jgi:hypothetical protein
MFLPSSVTIAKTNYEKIVLLSKVAAIIWFGYDIEANICDAADAHKSEFLKSLTTLYSPLHTADIRAKYTNRIIAELSNGKLIFESTEYTPQSGIITETDFEKCIFPFETIVRIDPAKFELVTSKAFQREQFQYKFENNRLIEFTK